jgi:hypothetical protein
MSNFTCRYPASAIAGKHRLTADDILVLRKHMFPTGLTSADDAEQLLAVHRSAAEKCPGWDNWFIETMAAYIVVHCYPQYSLDELNAEWLMALLAPDGVACNGAELEVVLHAIEMASAVPDILSCFALGQLQLALQGGRGAYAESRTSKRSGIASQDMAFVYRILRGSLFAGKMVLSKLEVSALDRIDALVRGKVNDPRWNALMRSLSMRTSEGHTAATPWLQMPEEDVALDEAA